MTTDPNTVNRTMLINAPIDIIWRTLLEDQLPRSYGDKSFMYGEWIKGMSIGWYQRSDEEERLLAKGRVLEVLTERRLRYTHFNSSTDLPDEPASYTTVDITLAEEPDGRVRIQLWQGEYVGLHDAARLASEQGRKWVDVLVELRGLCEARVLQLAS